MISYITIQKPKLSYKVTYSRLLSIVIYDDFDLPGLHLGQRGSSELADGRSRRWADDCAG